MHTSDHGQTVSDVLIRVPKIEGATVNFTLIGTRDSQGNPVSVNEPMKEVSYDDTLEGGENTFDTPTSEELAAGKKPYVVNRSKDDYASLENGKIAKHNTEINYQERFDEWQSSFQKNEDGSIKTDITGKKILTKEARAYYDEGREKGSATVHKDHTVSVAEITRDSEAAAHMSKEDKKNFANGDKNLKDLDAAANMSKSDKSMEEWLDSER